MHIETLFSIPDISSQLDTEARRFKKIDASYSKLLQRVSENRHVLACCYSDQQAKNLLPHILQKLEHCETLLVKILEGKRACFPRFYFVSDNRLLRMISEGCIPSSLENTLNCVFNEVTSVLFEDDNYETLKSIHSRNRKSEDVLGLCEPVALQREIERFLVDLWTEMGRSLRSLVQDIRSERHSSQLQSLILNFPSQICLLDIQIQWTKDCKDALSRARVEKNIMVYTSKRNATLLSDLLSLLSGSNFEEISTKHESVELLVMVQIFQRDRFDSLVQDKATSPYDFDFQKLIKFYWKDDTLDIVVAIAHVELDYGFEFLGIQDRIVATPQTDRCFVALACAVGAGVGSTVTGPSGTGKSALIKDLGKSTGRFVFVFHGTALFESSMFDHVLKGLASCGAWGCLEHFTSLELRILSVCAQQITTLFTAIREKR
jgi:dynein heavy chain, axonemal